MGSGKRKLISSLLLLLEPLSVMLVTFSSVLLAFDGAAALVVALVFAGCGFWKTKPMSSLLLLLEPLSVMLVTFSSVLLVFEGAAALVVA